MDCDGDVESEGVTPADAVVSTFHRRLEYGYPTPFLGRDAALAAVDAALRPARVLSRGRFGAWRYEVSNQDHSFMQGVEAADWLVSGRPEETVADATRVNAGKDERAYR